MTRLTSVNDLGEIFSGIDRPEAILFQKEGVIGLATVAALVIL